MAINIPILTEFSDAGLKSAQGAFNNFKSKVAEADGAMGKLKAGSGAAFDAIKANAGAMALGAGAAIGAFAVKAVGDFQKLALEVDKFANTTGLAAEEASRWTEIAGDLGVESTSVSNAMNKLNRAVATNSSAFAELGAEIVRTSTGATDVNATFLNTIEALRKVEDPAKRAQLATQILGKSWGDLSEFVKMGSKELKASLDSVGAAKIIDEREIEKAKRLREVQDNLGDAIENVSLALGEALLPALTAIAGPFEDLAKQMSEASDAGLDLGDGALTMLAKKLGILDDGQKDVNDTMQEAWQGYYSARRAAQTLTTALEDNASITQEVDEQWQKLLGTISQQEAWNNLLDRLDDVNEQSYEALVSGTAADARQAENAVADLTREVYDYIRSVGTIPPKVESRIIGLLERGAFDEALAILNNLRLGAVVPITPQPGAYNPPAPGGQTGGPGFIPNPFRPGGVKPFATATPMSNITVNVGGSVISENDLIETVRKGLVNAQRNGSGLVYSNV